MAAAKHTPGPWYFRPEHAIVYRDIGDRRYEVAGLADWDEETAGNGRLIAAAPELLEGLSAVIEYLDAYGTLDTADGAHFIGKARAAIAKATGDQQ